MNTLEKEGKAQLAKEKFLLKIKQSGVGSLLLRILSKEKE